VDSLNAGGLFMQDSNPGQEWTDTERGDREMRDLERMMEVQSQTKARFSYGSAGSVSP